MKRKSNPIRGTVENWISRRSKGKKPKIKITLKTFFEDLENRGPDNFKSDQQFKKWTKKIRRGMMKAETWVNDNSDPVLFVREYISHLQAEFWKNNKSVARDIERMSRMYWPMDLEKSALFDDIYSKIRIFGLRKKLYYLQKPIRVTIFMNSCVVAYDPGKYARDHWHPIIHVNNTFFATPFGMGDIFDEAIKTVNLWYKFR